MSQLFRRSNLKLAVLDLNRQVNLALPAILAYEPEYTELGILAFNMMLNTLWRLNETLLLVRYDALANT